MKLRRLFYALPLVFVFASCGNNSGEDIGNGEEITEDEWDILFMNDYYGNYEYVKELIDGGYQVTTTTKSSATFDDPKNNYTYEVVSTQKIYKNTLISTAISSDLDYTSYSYVYEEDSDYYLIPLEEERVSGYSRAFSYGDKTFYQSDDEIGYTESVQGIYDSFVDDSSLEAFLTYGNYEFKNGYYILNEDINFTYGNYEISLQGVKIEIINKKISKIKYKIINKMGTQTINSDIEEVCTYGIQLPQFIELK